VVFPNGRGFIASILFIYIQVTSACRATPVMYSCPCHIASTWLQCGQYTEDCREIYQLETL